MKLEIFSVFDSKADAFINPFFLQHVAMATRAIVDAGTDPTSMFKKHPEDYTLFHLGQLDDHTAAFEMLLVPENLGTVAQLLQAEALTRKAPLDYVREA